MYTKRERSTIDRARSIIEAHCVREGTTLSSPEDTKELLVLRFAGQEREVFTVLFLNSQHAPIVIEDLFFGTVDASAVYPREVVKRALKHNAAAVIFSHNHPSGEATPSSADRRITERLISALALVDVRVLDHIIVGGTNTYSFAQSGLL